MHGRSSAHSCGRQIAAPQLAVAPNNGELAHSIRSSLPYPVKSALTFHRRWLSGYFEYCL